MNNILPFRKQTHHTFDLKKTHEYFRQVAREHRLKREMDERNKRRLEEYRIRVQKYYGFYVEVK